MSDALPATPEQIARPAVEAAQAGAAIIHLHARDPETGEPTPDPVVFMRFLPVIKQSTDAVVNITTGRGLNMTVDDRLAAPPRAKPEMCSLNMGSMNFNIARAGDRVKHWKHAWEKPYLDRTDDHIFRNTFRDIARIVEVVGKGHGTRFEFEGYDVGHLYNLAYCLERRIVEPPLFVQTIFGIMGGFGAEPRNLLFMKETADRLFGGDYVWLVLAVGRHQMALTTMAGILGGNVRIGLEDSLYIGRGKLARSNAEQVGKNPPYPRGTEPRDRKLRRSPREAQAQRRGPGWLLIARTLNAPGPAPYRAGGLPQSRPSRPRPPPSGCRLQRGLRRPRRRSSPHA